MDNDGNIVVLNIVTEFIRKHEHYNDTVRRSRDDVVVSRIDSVFRSAYYPSIVL